MRASRFQRRAAIPSPLSIIAMASKTALKSALEHQAPQATRRVTGTIRVRALRRGFYDNELKEADAVFTIRSKKELGSWMELVSGDAPAADASDDAPKSKAPTSGEPDK